MATKQQQKQAKPYNHDVYGTPDEQAQDQEVEDSEEEEYEGEEEEVQEQRGNVALVPHSSQQGGDVQLMTGLSVSPGASFAEKKRALATADRMTGGESSPIDKLLNTTIWVSSCAQHKVRVRDNDGFLRDKVRTVLHVIGSKGQIHETKKVSFVSLAVAGYFLERVIPLFGYRFEDALPFLIEKTQARGGMTYTVTLVEGKTFPEM